MAKSKRLLSGAGWEFVPGGRTQSAAEAQPEISLPDERQVVRIALQKRARGKVVTLLTGLVLTAADTAAIAAELKKHCGAGGRSAAGEIELQGDHREKVAAFAAARGWKCRLTDGRAGL